MAHTNATPNYSLPQFIGTDKPAWLTDFNGAMSAIDTAVKANEVSAATATASSAQNATAIAAQATAISTLQTKGSALEAAEPINEAQIATNTQNIATNAQNIVQIDNTLGHTSIAGIGDGKVTGAIADIDSRVDVLENAGSVSVQADGVKTNKVLLNELFALVDMSKVTYNTKLVYGANVYTLSRKETSALIFGCTMYIADIRTTAIKLHASASEMSIFVVSSNNAVSYTDSASSVASADTIITIKY